ncbi:hypothetical protein BTM273_11840 [Helicobacter pylori]
MMLGSVFFEQLIGSDRLKILHFSWLSGFVLKTLAKNIACYDFALFASPKYSLNKPLNLQIPNNSGVVFTSFSRTIIRSQENLNPAITKT